MQRQFKTKYPARITLFPGTQLLDELAHEIRERLGLNGFKAAGSQLADVRSRARYG